MRCTIPCINEDQPPFRTSTSCLQGPLYFWSYMYYLSKFYELLDTVLLVVKVRAAYISKASSDFSGNSKSCIKYFTR